MTVTNPPQHRFVEQVMGMPVSLALRGRHTDDDAAHHAWEACLEVLHEADRVFSTYRTDSFLSRPSTCGVRVPTAPSCSTRAGS